MTTRLFTIKGDKTWKLRTFLFVEGHGLFEKFVKAVYFFKDLAKSQLSTLAPLSAHLWIDG